MPRSLSFRPLAVLVALMACPQLLLASPDEQARRVFGGQFFDLTETGVAQIVYSQGGTCSGVLVSPTLILTAAHCVVDDNGGSLDMSVVVGGNLHAVTDAFYSAGYQPGLPVGLEKNRHDLGMLVLGNPVTSVTPAPVWYDMQFLTLPVDGVLAGFGMNNEGISRAEDNLYAAGKRAVIRIVDRLGGILKADFEPTRSASCAGDSGGPLFVIFGIDTSAALGGVYGTVSFGVIDNNQDVVCDVNGRYTGYVDLTSGESAAFLASFPEVYRASGRNAFINVTAKELLAEINASLPQAKKVASAKKLGRLLQFKSKQIIKLSIDPIRKGTTRRLGAMFTLLRNSSDLSEARKSLLGMRRLLNRVVNLGIG
jgi:hypothetical protein